MNLGYATAIHYNIIRYVHVHIFSKFLTEFQTHTYIKLNGISQKTII
jgi:hypothetical protein